MFEEKYNELSLGEKNQFGSVVNTILLKGFIVRDVFDPKEKIIKISPTYRFIEKNYELINFYLSFSNWRIEKDAILGVVALLNENNENHIRLDRETSLLIFTLRLIYETERDQSSSTSEAIYLTTQSLIRTMLEHGILLPNKKLTGRNLAKSLRFLVQHNILNKVSGNYDEGNVAFYILPSIVYALDNEKVAAMSNALDQINSLNENDEVKEDETYYEN